MTFKRVGGSALALAVLVAGVYLARSLLVLNGRTGEGYQLLTPMPGASGFEPRAQPDGPVLENQSASELAVNFGYKVGGVSFSYSMMLGFAHDADEGRATVTVRRADRSASSTCSVVRRWDEPRGAYAVAVTDRFDAEPRAPALCLKAVIGPSKAALDLRNASLCIAQRDADGQCHPETLACGLIR